VAAIAFFGMVIGVGRVGSFEALRLIESVLPTARFLGSTVTAAATTVLALLLTIMGLSLTSEFTFKPRLYDRARNITTLSVITIIMGVGLLLAVSVPISEVEEFRRYYVILYYILAGAMAVVGGLIVAVGLMIGATLRGLIDLGHPEGASDLVADSELPESQTRR